jgi:hypothetical protein
MNRFLPFLLALLVADLARASNTTMKIAGIALGDHDNIKITTMFSVNNDPHLITSNEISKSFITNPVIK